jgi:hypothetical protein
MTRDAERFEVFEVMQAAKGTVRAERRYHVVYLQAVSGTALPPHPHGREIGRLT